MRRFGWLSLLVALLSVEAHAQVGANIPVEFGSSPNPVGSGARALGIGSAFIATADDATAASWNPGALIVLENPEASIVYSFKNRREAFAGIGVSEADEIQQVSYGALNYLSAAYPFKIGSRYFVASLNFQSLIDFDKDQQKTYFTSVAASPGVPSLRAETDVRFRQRGSLQAISPAIAFQLAPNLSVGVTLNISTSKLGFGNGWQQLESYQRRAQLGSNPLEDSFELRERNNFDGFGANLGVLWDITPRWTLGAVVKTPVAGTLSREIRRFERNGESLIDVPLELEDSYRLPPSYGVGVAYRFSDELTVSGDLYQTLWGLFRQEKTDPLSGESVAINPINARPYDSADVDRITQVHLGAEYLFIFPRTVVPIRGGLFYDPEPGDGVTSHFFGVALGTGISIWNDWVIDVAYQAR
ncbi:MAG: outer membrane protein transport protein, partial [Myxococcota bacterium]